MLKKNDYSKNFNKKLQESFAFAKTTLDDWSILQIIMTMHEEFGAISENILFESGQVQHKKPNETLTSVIADCLIMTTHYTAALTRKFAGQTFYNIPITKYNLSDDVDVFIINRNIKRYYEENYRILEYWFEKFKNPLNSGSPDTLKYFINSLIELNFIYTIQNLKNMSELKDDLLFEKSLENLTNIMDKKINKWKLVENKNKS